MPALLLLHRFDVATLPERDSDHDRELWLNPAYIVAMFQSECAVVRSQRDLELPYSQRPRESFTVITLAHEVIDESGSFCNVHVVELPHEILSQL